MVQAAAVPEMPDFTQPIVDVLDTSIDKVIGERFIQK